MHLRVVVLVAALAAVAAGCGGGSQRPSADAPGQGCEPERLLSIGDPLPFGCSFERFDGGRLQLVELRGKPAILNFWASWCTFCIKEMPDFERVHRDLRDALTVVGVNLLHVDGETRAEAKRFAKARGVTYTLIYDPNGLLYGHFAARLVAPATIFVDAQGHVALRKFGPLDERQLRELAREHLGV